MRSFKLSLIATAFMASTAITHAADVIESPTYEPMPQEVMPAPSASGWYIRGDIGHATLETDSVRYYQGATASGSFEQKEFDDTWALQGGLGYQVTDYLRVDGTFKYLNQADFDGSSEPGPTAACNGGFGNFCSYNDDAELHSASILLANAYLDLGTVNGFTGYVGAGIGAAHIQYGDLFNDQTCVGSADDALCSASDFTHLGEESWRFAYALHAGVSYDVSCRTKIDAGYSYTSIDSGRMFSGSTTNGGSPGFDGGIDVHEGRVGVRYALSDAGCSAPVYAEAPAMVYK